MSAVTDLAQMTWPLLGELTTAEVTEVLAATRTRHLRRGEAAYWEGDLPDGLYLLEAGHVSVRVSTPGGDVAMVRVLGPGAHFGELALVSSAPRVASAAALDDVQVRVLSGRCFARVKAHFPGVQRLVLSALAAEADRLSSALADSYFLPVADRTVRRLVELVAVFGGADGRDVVVPLTQEEVAQLVGSARPTVNRVLQDLQSAGLVTVGRGRVTIPDVDLLRARAAAPRGARAA
jgi:CRP-like cAMP-binding protein